MTNFNIIILFTLAEFLLMCNSNYGSIMHHFDIYDFEKYCDFEISVRNQSRLSKQTGAIW